MKQLLPLAIVALLAGCGEPEPETNAATKSILVENETMVIPQANVAVENAAAVEAPEATAAVNLAPDGLSLVLPNGSARQATFDTAKEMTLRMVSSQLGNPIEQGENEECGSGPLSFANFRGGLSLYFQDEKFAGWDLDGREGGKFTTAAGVGIGSTRKQLEDVVEAQVADTSLGIEFTSGQLAGLLSSRAPEGQITNLWAGATCIAR